MTGKYLRRARLAVVAVALGLLALELGLYHLGGYGRTPATTPDAVLGYRTVPNQAVRAIEGTSYRINDLGFRDRDWATPTVGAESAERPLRIAVLGDSMTYGPFIEIEAVWTRLLEDTLRRATQRGVLVMNFAQPGYVFEQLVRTWEVDVRAFRPDILIVAVNPHSARPMQTFPPANDFPLRSFVLKTAIYDYLRFGVFHDESFLQFDRDDLPQTKPAAPKQTGPRASMKQSPYDPRHDDLWTAMRDRCAELVSDCRALGTDVYVLCIPQVGDVLGESEAWCGDRWAAWIAEGLACRLLDPLPDFRTALAPITDRLAAEDSDPRSLWSRRADPDLVARFKGSPDNLYIYLDPHHLSPGGHLRLADWISKNLTAGLQDEGLR